MRIRKIILLRTFKWNKILNNKKTKKLMIKYVNKYNNRRKIIKLFTYYWI